jgi:hypothetical protein
MHNKLRIILFGAVLLSALLFSSGMALPAYAATSSSATVSATSTVSMNGDAHAVTVPQRRGDYDRGLRDGYRAAVNICRASRRRPPHLRHRRRESDYEAGFVDGYNFALDNDRACRRLR